MCLAAAALYAFKGGGFSEEAGLANHLSVLVREALNATTSFRWCLSDVCQVGEFGARRRSHRTESHRPVRALDVHSVEEQHVQVDVEVERTTEALDQSDRAGSGRLVSVACFSDQMTLDPVLPSSLDVWL